MEKNITCRPDKPSCKASKSLSTKVKYSVFIESMRTYVQYFSSLNSLEKIAFGITISE